MRNNTETLLERWSVFIFFCFFKTFVLSLKKKHNIVHSELNNEHLDCHEIFMLHLHISVEYYSHIFH